MKFEDKVRSMSAAEIIMAMVEGLKNPRVTIRMSTFGVLEDNICYGCAATATICQIADKTPVPLITPINYTGDRAEFINSSTGFLDIFEQTIDALRQGNISLYNSGAKVLQIATIVPFTRKKLPFLRTDYSLQDLEAYKALAKHQSKFI